jgi:ATP/maltotriose-dependent transcriptional regulator MalT
MAEHWLLRGDLDQASGYAETLLVNSQRTGARKYVALAHKIRAEIAMAQGDNDAAEAGFDAALEALREHPTPLVAWKIHAALGRLRRQSYASAAAIIETIAAQVRDETLRTTFLNSPAVQEVVRNVGQAS